MEEREEDSTIDEDMAKMWKKDDLWSGDPTYINTVDLLFKG
jgi:hypothetical protein